MDMWLVVMSWIQCDPTKLTSKMIKSLVVVVLACVAISMATTIQIVPHVDAEVPSKPTPPHEWSADFAMHMTNLSLSGSWNQSDALNAITYGNMTYMGVASDTIQRFDLKTTFSYVPATLTCTPSALSGSSSQFFASVAYAAFNGTTTVNGVSCNKWVLDVGAADLTWCFTDDSKPVQYSYSTFTFQWTNHIVGTVNKDAFDIPTACHKNATVVDHPVQALIDQAHQEHAQILLDL
eukprot:TRINITY_DN3555_c0_g1_i5.p1 TRINITY_DN3555_c0_g1~~TRINITY_DN3555_c0_g1_i5.p1  ORF type:complete len:236 (-),score=57.26 TRINITY_DN3555_c0_g1_i5:717-1424(-)